MKRFIMITLAIAALIPIGIVGLEIAREPGRDQPGRPVANPGEQVRRGEYLARAGNCMACHTERGGKSYAGGRAIATPFGSIYSSNITADDETGIGKWTADDFWRAIHNGKSRDGSFLYPAFPYPEYTRVTREDADAIYAYLRSQSPVRQANRENDLRFPYNQRVLLAFWRLLYFNPGVYQPEAAQSPEWNRGAYLVQGLGHCAACHTARSMLGGTESDKNLAGGTIPMLNWYASSLTSDPATGLGDWEVKDIAAFLQAGASQRGAAFGPMAEVVSGSLQHLSHDDVQAMAVYLKSLPGADTEDAQRPAPPDAESILKQGKKLYGEHCVGCHAADGKGVPAVYPPLAGSLSANSASATNPIRVVLNGGFAPSTPGNPRPFGMPPFATILSDDEIASVVSYIRTSWDNKGGFVSPIDVGRARGAPVE